MSKKAQIVIADDHPLLLRGLKFLIEDEESLLLAGEATEGRTALKMIQMIKPDVAILDIEMPHLNGIEILEKIREDKLDVKVIFLTMHHEIELFKKSILLDVDGFLLKESIDTGIITAINNVLKGEKFYDPILSSSLIQNEFITKKTPTKIDLLTPTEKLVLQKISSKKTSRQIAGELFISKRTVDRHRSNICQKLELSGTNALLHFVNENRDKIV